MNDHSKPSYIDVTTTSNDGPGPHWENAFALIIWLLAGAVAFLPFALDTSPWDAVTLRVPGNQGNWWHVLVGLPFFLAFPMIWIRLRAPFSKKLPSPMGLSFIWSAVGLSVCGTILVEVPFLFHLAGTSQWQRFTVFVLGLGIVTSSSILLFRSRPYLSPTRACIIGLDAAYLANAALCLVVYGSAPGTIRSRSGWLVTSAIVWPMAFELIWLFAQTFGTQRHRDRSFQRV
jgi:hypothetical protein